MDSLNLAYCYDAGGDLGFTESYVAQKFLGAQDKGGFKHPSLDSTFLVHYNAWQFNNSTNPLFFSPTNDQARLIKMVQGLNHNPCWDNPNGAACQGSIGRDLQAELNAPGNRADLISAGPFERFSPGDEIEVVTKGDLYSSKEGSGDSE